MREIASRLTVHVEQLLPFVGGPRRSSLSTAWPLSTGVPEKRLDFTHAIEPHFPFTGNKVFTVVPPHAAEIFLS